MMFVTDAGEATGEATGEAYTWAAMRDSPMSVISTSSANILNVLTSVRSKIHEVGQE